MRLASTLFCLVFAAPAVALGGAMERLEGSPRHHEWVEVPAGKGRAVRSYVVYPQAAGKRPAVVVIHENRGLTDWVRSFADRLAEAGYVAVAPDLLSGFDAERAHTGDFASSDAAREAISRLDAGQVTSDLRAVQRYAAALPASNGATAAAGFCWGGAQSFRLAAHAPDLDAAFVFYGTGPQDEEVIRAIAAPVYGFYASDDARVNATIAETRRLMDLHGKTYEVEIYEGTGHGFMRQADEPDAAAGLRAASEAAWERLTRLLATLE
ncbi:MAG TPA: dienelactone hydrolase family protein [Thermoanaerobaculia bacterium]|nr:dienelactone hydrolase family protein [Thermoanaerobaculia bacterium]